MFTLLGQRGEYDGHVRRMDDTRILNNLLYGELATGKCHFLRFKTQRGASGLQFAT